MPRNDSKQASRREANPLFGLVVGASLGTAFNVWTVLAGAVLGVAIERLTR